MNKTVFIDWLESTIDVEGMPDDVRAFYEDFKKAKTKSKDNLSELGVKLLETLRDNSDEPISTKTIAEITGLSGRSIAGGMRSLVTKNFVTKMNSDPIEYHITESGIAALEKCSSKE